MLHHITTAIFPERCSGCQKISTSFQYGFCLDCWNRIILLNKPEGTIASLARFEGPVRDAIHSLKYRRAKWISVALAQWMAETLIQWNYRDFDMIVPVPLHWNKEFSRGFNQSWFIAAKVGALIGIPARHGAIGRKRNTLAQTRLTKSQREENVKGAFRARDRSVSGKKILLVDDVLTTGSTIKEVLRTLREAGAKRSMALTIAKA